MCRSTFWGGLLVLLAVPTLAADPPEPKPQKIANGVWIIAGGMLPNRQPDGNTIVFDAPEGLIIFDTGRHLWHRDAILDFARARRKPIAAIVNSHWHLDHVSGNPALKAAFPRVKVYASSAIQNALAGFLAKSAAQARASLAAKDLPPESAEDMRNDVATTEHGASLLPNIVITASGTRTIAGKMLVVNLASNAATDGEVWVFDPSTKVAVVGDLVTLPAPFLDTACPAGWSRALDDIEKTPFEILLPGHGVAMTREQFSNYRQAFSAFIACSASARASAICADGWARNTRALLGAALENAQRARRMAIYYVEMLRAHGGKSTECKV